MIALAVLLFAANPLVQEDDTVVISSPSTIYQEISRVEIEFKNSSNEVTVLGYSSSQQLFILSHGGGEINIIDNVFLRGVYQDIDVRSFYIGDTFVNNHPAKVLEFDFLIDDGKWGGAAVWFAGGEILQIYAVNELDEVIYVLENL